MKTNLTPTEAFVLIGVNIENRGGRLRYRTGLCHEVYLLSRDGIISDDTEEVMDAAIKTALPSGGYAYDPDEWGENAYARAMAAYWLALELEGWHTPVEADSSWLYNCE